MATAKKKPTKKAAQSQFFTRKVANDGIKFPLKTPDGQVTNEWLLIRGRDSDAVRKAHAGANRRMAEALAQAKGDESLIDVDDIVEDNRIRVIAAAIGGWSFDDECTMDNVVQFLKEAPQIADAVDLLCARRSEFFKKPSSSSRDTPAASSD